MKILLRPIPPLAASIAFALGFGLLAGACTPSVDLRGNLPAPERLTQITPGKTTRDEVQSLLGTPLLYRHLRRGELAVYFVA
ncbi:MAG: outer membrane protein assembly factor BamE [Magnetospirillum sp.]|nr:outer membrane protein assembly factor BamE [Magnetospirillum sp.]